MVGKDINHLKGVLLAATCRNPTSEYPLLTEVVHERREDKPGILGIRNRPAGKTARDRDYIVLGIAAVHTQRVQLHDLAAVVFVQPMRDPSEGTGQNGVGNAIDDAS